MTKARCIPHRLGALVLWSVVAVVAVAGGGPVARAEEGYEAAGLVAAVEYLPAKLLQGPDWTVAAGARADGLDNTYTIESRFGTWEARGEEEVATRIREIAALARLEEVSKTEVFLEAVRTSATAPLRLAQDVAEKPVETLTGIPKSVGRWFKRTSFRVREAYRDASEAIAEERAGQAGQGEPASGQTDEERQAKVEAKAREEARDYLRISGAERRWYRELRVDPYTDNEVLRQAVESVARVEGLTGFGMKFAGLPSLPGSREISKTMDLVWETDPVDLLLANRERMLAAGLSKETARAFEDSSLTLTEQTLFLDALDSLEGVAGREHLVARALDPETRRDGRSLAIMAVLLARLHRGGTPLAAILPGAVLPVARTAGGDLITVSTAGALFWTEAIAEAAHGFAAIYADDAARERRLYVTGIASERFATEAGRRGWKVIDRWRMDETEGTDLGAGRS